MRFPCRPPPAPHPSPSGPQLPAGDGPLDGLIHGWAHQKCSRPIRGLQLLGILHSPEQHAVHHTRPFDRHFCVMTDFANPVLEAVGFWETAETLVSLFGCEPRRERREA